MCFDLNLIKHIFRKIDYFPLYWLYKYLFWEYFYKMYIYHSFLLYDCIIRLFFFSIQKQIQYLFWRKTFLFLKALLLCVNFTPQIQYCNDSITSMAHWKFHEQVAPKFVSLLSWYHFTIVIWVIYFYQIPLLSYNLHYINCIIYNMHSFNYNLSK